MGLGRRISAARDIVQESVPMELRRSEGLKLVLEVVRLDVGGPVELGHVPGVRVCLGLVVVLQSWVLWENVAHQVSPAGVPLGQLGPAPRVPEAGGEGEAQVHAALARLQGLSAGGVHLSFCGHGCPDALFERVAAGALERQELG